MAFCLDAPLPFDYSTPMGSPCLSPTVFLDSDNPSVQRFASDAIGDAASPKERAIRLFYAVREQIPYDPYAAVLEADAMRASAVIAKGKGFCVAKAILLAAVLRAIGIPARLGFADVTNHLATRRLLELLRTDVFVFHGYAEVLLDDRWVKATPAFHSRLCARFGVPALDFDGEHDADSTCIASCHRLRLWTPQASTTTSVPARYVQASCQGKLLCLIRRMWTSLI